MPTRKGQSKKNAPRAAKVDRWGPDYLPTDPNSPLVSTDLIKLLSQPETWAQFSEEELAEISTKFPESVPRNENGSISIDWLRYNNDWRHGVRLWQADLEAGHLDPEWLREAAQAMEDRAAGKFDKFKEEEFEKFWGQKQKMDWSTRAGKSAALKLDDLIAGNLFQINDFWIYCRGFGFKPNHINVVKDCKIVAIGEKSMTFAIPPGQLRYARDIVPEPSSDPSSLVEGESAPTQEDVILCEVENVRALENKILEADGRIKNPYPANSWKMIRCQRNNQDLGSLFDVRESYWNRTHRK